MDWIGIASIVFVCVTMNHLGLISKVEEVMGKELHIANCPKCGSFWVTLIYSLWGMTDFYGEFPMVLAISFLASYTSLWLELFEGYIDTLYDKLYEKIYRPSDDNEAASDPDKGDTAGPVSQLRKDRKDNN